MNWISNYVRPKINSLFNRREVPENLWVKCDNCGTMLFHRELADSLNVCTNCGHHLAIIPRDRFRALFDGGVFLEVPVPKPLTDPLGFKDQKKYPDRLREARKKTGEEEAMLVAEGEIGRLKTVCVGQDFGFMAGSMGMYVGNAIVAGAERAVKRKCPLILFAAAGGARMQEGILSLMQMPRSTVAVEMLKEAGLPYVVVLTQSDHRRRHRQLRHARRHPDRRAGGADLLRRARASSSRPSARRCPRASSAPSTCSTTACSTGWCRARTCATSSPPSCGC